MYFIMSSFPFAALSGLYCIEQIREKKKLFYFALTVLLIFSISDFNRFIVDRVKAPIQNAMRIAKGEDVDRNIKNAMSYEEYELALWLKENTGPNDIIAVDTFEYDGMKKEELLGVFSQRFIWNDGQYSDAKETKRRREIVGRLFGGDKNALRELKEENVMYIVETLSQNRNRLFDMQAVYECDDYVVYKVE